MVLFAQFDQILFVMRLPMSFLFAIELLSDFLRVTALVNEPRQLLQILFSVLRIFVWVIGLQTDRQELQGALF